MATWNWRNATDAAAVDAAQLRRSGLLRAAIGVVAGAILLWFGGLWMACIAWGIAAVLGLTAAVSPGGAYAAIDGVLGRFANGVGQIIGWIVLVPVFFLVFVPFRVLARRGDADAMKRHYDPNATTYWRNRPAEEPSLDRQF